MANMTTRREARAHDALAEQRPCTASRSRASIASSVTFGRGHLKRVSRLPSPKRISPGYAPVFIDSACRDPPPEELGSVPAARNLENTRRGTRPQAPLDGQAGSLGRLDPELSHQTTPTSDSTVTGHSRRTRTLDLGAKRSLSKIRRVPPSSVNRLRRISSGPVETAVCEHLRNDPSHTGISLR